MSYFPKGFGKGKGGKGKGKGMYTPKGMKGIGKGKGIGAMNEYTGGKGIGAMYEGTGGTEFYGERYNCGEWGHSQWYCPFTT